MADAAVTYTFTSGTTAASAEVNQNFTDLLNFFNTTGVHVFQAGTVVEAALADGAVTNAKCADDVFGAWRDVSSHWLQATDTIAANETIALASSATTSHRTDAGTLASSGANMFGAVVIDPADYVGDARAAEFRMKVCAVSNATNPAQAATVKIRKVSSVAGGVVTGATATLIHNVNSASNLAADTVYNEDSTTFSLTDGAWVISWKWGSTATAGTIVHAHVRLQVREQ